MSRFNRTIMSGLAITLVVVFSAMWAMPVLADDGAPPPENAESGAPPQEETQPEEGTLAVPEEEAQVAEVPPSGEAVEVLQPEEAGADESLPEEVDPAELLSELPEGTELAVVDEDGSLLPLATSEAEQAVEVIDPVWCPAGVSPQNGTGGCTPAYGSLYALVNDIVSGAIAAPGTNGVIWIQSGADGSSNPILIDGSDPDLGTWSTYSLTLQGGWSGTLGSTAVDPNAPAVVSQPLSIINWNNAITLNNIVVQGASGAGYALDVETTGNITLSSVDVVDNSAFFGGALLDNRAGNGNVMVNDSTFDGNTGAAAWGLEVYSNGTISAKNLSANGNTNVGAWLSNSGASMPKTVTLAGSNYFQDNGGTGLYVYSQGAITLSNVTAIYNGNSGAELDNCFYDPYSGWCEGLAPANVTLKGASNFSGNGWDGLRVWSSGMITTSNLTADGNGWDTNRPAQTMGFDAYGKGTLLVNFGSWTSKTITLNGTNTFTNNASTGLYADTWSVLKVNNLTASGNGWGCDPAETYEDSFMCDGAGLHGGSSLLLTGYGTFEYNYDDGLESTAYGPITLNNLYAVGNGWWGAFANSFGPSAAVNVLGTNVFFDNQDTGLEVWSGGIVTLSNVTAYDNGVDGVYVYNLTWKWVWDSGLSDWVPVPVAKPVLLKGPAVFYGNWAYGLEVHSFGAITTNGVDARYNGDGVYLDNCNYDSDPLVDDCTGIPGQPVSMNGTNTMNLNNGNGLWIESLGNIKVSNLTANDNDWFGAILDNNWNRSTGTVTITGYANTSGNDFRGLGVYSTKTITVSNLTANVNGEVGVRLFNAADPAKPANITLLGYNMICDNWNTGLDIDSYGIVTLNNVTASYNGEPYDAVYNPTPWGAGIDVVNSNAWSAKPITLNGTTIANWNLNDGLYLTSLGTITINQVTANENGGHGAYVDNQWGFQNANITFKKASVFNGNGSLGLEVYSHGNIITSGLTANYNSGATTWSGYDVGGAYFDNWSLTSAPVNVTLLGFNTFNGNGTGDGLMIYSDGQITLNNITANDNFGNGAFLNNYDYSYMPRNIILNGNNTFLDNGFDGLYIDAYGAVILSRITASYNGWRNGVGSGVVAYASGPIALTCGSMAFNGGYGYYLFGSTETVKGAYAYGNPFGTTPVTSYTRTCPLP